MLISHVLYYIHEDFVCQDLELYESNGNILLPKLIVECLV